MLLLTWIYYTLCQALKVFLHLWILYSLEFSLCNNPSSAAVCEGVLSGVDQLKAYTVRRLY